MDTSRKEREKLLSKEKENGTSRRERLSQDSKEQENSKKEKESREFH